MSRSWWLVVVLLALIQYGKAQDNIHGVPVSSTTARPGIFTNIFTTISDLFHGKKTEVPYTNTTRNPPSNQTLWTPDAVPAIHGQTIPPDTILDTKNHSIEGSNRDPKCIPVTVNVSTTTDNSRALEDRFLNVLSEIENMTIDLTPDHSSDLRNLTQGPLNVTGNETVLRDPKGLIQEQNKGTNRGARCGIPPIFNSSVTTENSSPLLVRVFKLFSEIENSTRNATSATVTDSRTLPLVNRTSVNGTLLRVGKELEIDVLNTTQHGNGSKAGCRKHHGTHIDKADHVTYHRNSPNMSENTHPRSQFFHFLNNLRLSKNHSTETSTEATYRLARYIKHISIHTKGNYNNYFIQFFDKMKQNNWTYARTARYIIDSSLFREGRDLDDLDGDLDDDLWERSGGNGTDGVSEDLSSEGNWSVLGEVPYRPREVDLDSETDNDTIEIIFESESESLLDIELRQAFRSDNLSDKNVTSLVQLLRVDHGNATDGPLDSHIIPKSAHISESNISDSNSTSIKLTPKSDSNIEVLVNSSHDSGNLTSHASGNLTSANIAPKWSGVILVSNETNDNNETYFPRWSSELDGNDAFNVTPKVLGFPLHDNETDFSSGLDGNDSFNVTPKFLGLPLDENDTRGFNGSTLVKIAVEIEILAEAEIEISDRNSNITMNDTWIRNGTNFTHFVPPSYANTTKPHFDQLVFTLVIDDNSTDNFSAVKNDTEGSHYVFSFLGSNHTNGTDHRHSYNTSVGRNNYHFHVQDQGLNPSRPHFPPRPSEDFNFIEQQPPFVWRDPSERLKIYIPPPLLHHFHNPAIPQQFPRLKMVCPPSPAQMCPPWIEDWRKCSFPMDCPLPQLCCQVGCEIKCVHGILVPVLPHFY